MNYNNDKLMIIFIIILFLLPKNSWCESYLKNTGNPVAPEAVPLGDPDIMRWESATINWKLNRLAETYLSVTNSQIVGLINSAYSQWVNATDNLVANYQNLTDNTYGDDGENVHYWTQDLNDPIYSLYGGPIGPPGDPIHGGAAVGFITAVDDIIVDADVIYEGYYRHGWNDGGYLDIWGIALHEIGHTIGFHHSQDLDAVMHYDDSHPRYLTQDDIIGAVFLYDGILLRSQSLTGPKTFKWDITIPQSTSIYLYAGTGFYFKPGTSLTVEGTLTVDGLQYWNTVFDRIEGTSGSWGGIKFESGSSGSISYATIQHATQGICCNNTGSASITISNCYIWDNFNYGINLYNSSPIISNNSILNNGQYGVYCNYYSSPKVTVNTIKGHTIAGIHSTNYSAPTGAATYYGSGSNVIKDNTGYGLSADYNGIMYFGSAGGGGSNSIYNNSSYEARACYSSTIWARYNWWGAYPPSGSEFSAYQSTIYHEYELSSDPNSDRQKIVSSDDIDNLLGSISLSVKGSDFGNSIMAETDEDYDQDIQYYLDLFRKEGNTLQGKYALIKLEESYWKSKKDGFENFVNKEIFSRKGVNDELTVMGLELINHSLLDRGDYKAVIKNLEKIKSELLLNDYIEKNTLFTLGSVYLNCLSNKTEASKYFEELKEKYPKDLLVLNSEILLGNNPNPDLFKQNNDEKVVFNLEPSNNLSVENYPNPFNPTTKISFNLPSKDLVKLKVFDILGREVAVLADNVYEPGKYEVEFNASNLPSGVYFYNLTTGNNSITKKMLFLK